jgi:hypothetical protein
MRQFRTYGSARGVPGNRYPYRNRTKKEKNQQKKIRKTGKQKTEKIRGRQIE